ncbi:MAG: hypothetical protein HYU36_02790 [Planctomycetes bacterium]|nr:hypothetical protein [Planctomycetota bacterium]
MKVLDYARSFVTFVTSQRGNNARLLIESRCVLTDARAGSSEEYFLFASCKSEHTYAEKNLFQDPNYDFCGIFGREDYVIFRTRSEWHDGCAERGTSRDRFQDVLWHVCEVESPRMLETNEEIVRVTMQGRPLVGQVQFASRDGSLNALLEFPIKTMNVNDIRWMYQVDTGPLPFPDLEMEAGRPIDRFELAYVAYNVPDFADFILQQKTALPGSPIRTVMHYSGIRTLRTRNAVILADG